MSSSSIRVLIVEDSLTMRAMLRELIEAGPNLEVIGAVGSAEEALKVIPLIQPDVITLDQHLPGISGLDMLIVLNAAGVESKVVMLSSEARLSAPFCEEAFKRGAIACFNKAKVAREGEELIQLISLAAYGRVPVNPGGFGTILPGERVDYI